MVTGQLDLLTMLAQPVSETIIAAERALTAIFFIDAPMDVVWDENRANI
jgi:hypothetical protein